MQKLAVWSQLQRQRLHSRLGTQTGQPVKICKTVVISKACMLTKAYSAVHIDSWSKLSKMMCQHSFCFCAVYLYGASASLRNPSCRLSSNLQHHSKPVFAIKFVTVCKSHNCGFGACVVPVLTCTVLDQIQLQLCTLVLPDGVCLGFQLLEAHSAER